MGQTKDGALKIAASKIGVTLEDYRAKLAAGLKWCTGCKTWHNAEAFGVDLSRGDQRSAKCLSFGRVKQRAIRTPPAKRGWIEAVRDGDKKQARRRINYLVEQGLIPHPDDLPCMDCGDMVFIEQFRHEYDHARGYDRENQLYVEPVCSRCHHSREEIRRGIAA